ncbi:glycosyltransferase [Streptomyces sp. NBC_01433]|uniref:glycosyltransferase family 2 protein n=1 Tax=Streptomyces sp. NBC_01433 TaxID=2903864 RepID=UPI00225A2269|nr:glycosyltransferase [Streptomyces sp. NBC_01433]MCX4681282.1 glycosyltransferase [Streptomyces sp. NBC_01433]
MRPLTEAPRPGADAGRSARISVLIPAYNARTTLRACLLSLTHQTQRTPYTYEVIVVDDGSSDGTKDMVAGFPGRLDLHYAYEPRSPASGRARARNIALATATGDLVVTLDADQVVAPDFLDAHVRAHAAGPALLVVGSRLQLDEGEIDQEALAERFDLSSLPEVVRGDERDRVFRALGCGLADMETAWHYPWTCNVSVRRDRLIAVGGFDESFTGWGLEDAELGYRLVKDGVRMHYTTGAAVYHEHRLPVTADQYRQWRRNLEYFIRKHPDPVVRLQEMFAPAIDPDTLTEEDWVDTAVRFEHAARALTGPDRPLPVH